MYWQHVLAVSLLAAGSTSDDSFGDKLLTELLSIDLTVILTFTYRELAIWCQQINPGRR